MARETYFNSIAMRIIAERLWPYQNLANSIDKTSIDGVELLGSLIQAVYNMNWRDMPSPSMYSAFNFLTKEFVVLKNSINYITNPQFTANLNETQFNKVRNLSNFYSNSIFTDDIGVHLLTRCKDLNPEETRKFSVTLAITKSLNREIDERAKLYEGPPGLNIPKPPVKTQIKKPNTSLEGQPQVAPNVSSQLAAQLQINPLVEPHVEPFALSQITSLAQSQINPLAINQPHVDLTLPIKPSSSSPATQPTLNQQLELQSQISEQVLANPMLNQEPFYVQRGNQITRQR